MRNFLDWYYQNTRKFWIIIIMIIFALILLRVVNNIVKQNKEQQKIANQNQVNTIADVQTSYNENYAALSFQENSSSITKENVDVIKEFFNYCNNREVEKAYNLLSSSCKELLYSNINTFIENYYNTVFQTVKSYNQEAWMSRGNNYTYRIVIIEDPLATGKVSYGNAFQDFYTVVKENGESKLNISSFVSRENLDKSSQINGVTVNVKYRDNYMNYTDYVLEVKNSTDKIVALDSLEKADTLYLLGEAENKYSSFNSEINTSYFLGGDKQITNSIVIPSGETRNIKIKFNKIYNPERKITAMEFSNFISDYQEFLNNKNNYNAQTIRIKL